MKYTTINYTSKEGLEQQAKAVEHNVSQNRLLTHPHLFRSHRPDGGGDWWTQEQARRRREVTT